MNNVQFFWRWCPRKQRWLLFVIIKRRVIVW